MKPRATRPGRHRVSEKRAAKKLAQKIVRRVHGEVAARVLEKLIQKTTDEIVYGDGIGFKPLKYKPRGGE
jgi:hypothetical protein